MIDLETQLREYIDGIADPIPSPTARAVVPEPVRRRRGAALVAAVVVVVLVVTIVAVALLARSDDAPTRIEPSAEATECGAAEGAGHRRLHRGAATG